MEIVLTVSKQIIILIVLGLFGFMAMRRKWVPDNAGTVLASIVVKITAPALIFTSMASKEFGYAQMHDGLIIFFAAIIFISIAFAISIAGTKLMKLDPVSANVYQSQAMVGNTIFLAFPLLNIIDASNGVLYAIFYNLGNDIFLWTVCIFLLNGHNQSNIKSKLKMLLNPNSIAFFLGLTASLLRLNDLVKFNVVTDTIYSVIFEALKGVGSTTIYLSMLFIGMVLANMKYTGVLHMIRSRYSVLVYSFFKLIFVPLMAFGILAFLFPGVGLATSVVVLQLGMPASVTLVALAAEYGSNHEYSTEILSVSTALSVITLPFLVYFLSIIPH